MNNKLKTFVIAIAVPLFSVHIGLLSIQAHTWEDVELHISPSEITADRWNSETNEYSTDTYRRTGDNSYELDSTFSYSGDWKFHYDEQYLEVE
jgi:hypothetical protein